jgi:DNA-binding transcriptional LysR family regulator
MKQKIGSFTDDRLRYLFESVRLGTMRAASEYLDIAPSSISRQISSLERELGTLLVEKGRHTIQLTTAGELVVDYYRERLSQREALVAAIDDLRGSRKGHLTIAVGQGLVRMPLVRTLREFMSKYPGIGLSLRSVSSREVGVSVRTDEAHFGIMLDAPHDPRIRTRFNIPQPYYLILFPSHPLAKRSSIKLKDLVDQRLLLPEEGFRVREILAGAERDEGIFLTAVMTASSIQMLTDCVLAEIGMTIMPEACALDLLETGKLVAIPIEHMAFNDSKANVVTRIGRQLPGSAITLLDLLERGTNPLRPIRKTHRK